MDKFDQMTILLIEMKKLNQSTSKIANSLEKIEQKEILRRKEIYLAHRIENFIRNKLPNRIKQTIRNFTILTNTKNNSKSFDLSKLDLKPADQIPEITIITWDCAHNAAGPAYWIADALTQSYKCEVVSGLHERFGNTIWEPISRVPVITRYVNVSDNLWDQAKLEYFALGSTIQSDTIICTKYRPGSIYILLGALSVRPRKVIFFVDDEEQQFAKENPEFLNDCKDEINECMGLISKMKGSNLSAPNTSILSKFTNSNKKLIAHTRPNYLIKIEPTTRNNPDKINIGFFGTVRKHKGINRLLSSLYENKNIYLTIAGDLDQETKNLVGNHLERNRITILPILKYDQMMKYLCEMDFVMYASEISSKISQQTTAKISDAIGLGVTPIISNTEGNKHFLDERVALDIEEIDLTKISLSEKIKREGLKEYFQKNICYNKIEETIFSIVSSLKETSTHIPDWITKGTSKSNQEIKTIDNRFIYIHLWKQYDSGLWGRRVDNIAKYQHFSNRVKSTLIINKPVKKSALESKFNKKSFEEKIKQTKFGSRHYQPLLVNSKPNQHIEELLAIIKNNHENVRFIIYPYVDYIDLSSECFQSNNTIVDVVDNQTLFSQRDSHSAKIIKQYSELAARFTTINNRSKQTLSDFGIGIDHVVQNSAPSIDFNHSQINCPPKVWYPGNLDVSRLDLNLLQKIQKKLPDLRLNFVGAIGATPFAQEGFTNIDFHEPVLLETLTQMIGVNDIIIIPHAKNALTNSMDPLKLYLGALNGLRVISTVKVDLSGNYNVWFNSDHAEFLRNLENCINDRDFIFKKPFIHPLDTWESRVKQIEEIFYLNRMKK